MLGRIIGCQEQMNTFDLLFLGWLNSELYNSFSRYNRGQEFQLLFMPWRKCEAVQITSHCSKQFHRRTRPVPELHDVEKKKRTHATSAIDMRQENNHILGKD